MVSKKGTNELRMRVDYRMLNEYTVKDADPLPRIDDSITNLGDAKYLSKFDFGRVFHQVPNRECDQYKTAFSTPKGLFHWTHMLFGLCNATATYQRLMDMVLSGIRQCGHLLRGRHSDCYSNVGAALCETGRSTGCYTQGGPQVQARKVFHPHEVNNLTGTNSRRRRHAARP